MSSTLVVVLNGDTKQVIKEWPLSSLQRWAPSKTGFVLDFGAAAAKQRYYPIETVEGEQLAQLATDCVEQMKSKKRFLPVDEFAFPPVKKPTEVVLANISLGLSCFSSHSQSLSDIVPSAGFLTSSNRKERLESARRVVRSQVGSGIASFAALVRCFPQEKLASPETIDMHAVSGYLATVIISIERLRVALCTLASTLIDPSEMLLEDGKEILGHLRDILGVGTNLLKHILLILGLYLFFFFSDCYCCLIRSLPL